MSTMTLRKRIALAAVTALGAGLLSVVPVSSANATAGDLTFTGIGLLGSDTRNSSTTQTATILTTGSLVVTTTGGDGSYYVVSAGASITSATAAQNNGVFTAPDGISADQKKFLADDAGDTFTVVPTGAAGSTFTITGYTGATTGVVTDVLTVSIAATSEFGVASPSMSKLSWVGTSTGEATSDAVGASTTDYVTNALYLNIQLNDAYGNDITSGTGALVATVSAGATVGFGAAGAGAPTAGTFTQAVSSAVPTSINLVVKQATVGAGWNGTVTVTYNGVTIGTKSGKITGAPASIAVTPTKIVQINATSTEAWSYIVKDVAGNELATTAANVVLSSSSDTSVVSAAVGSTNADPTATTTSGTGNITCLKGGSSKVVMQITTNGAVTKSNEFTALCGDAAYSYTASFDKASYVQGEVATLTVVFKDAKGNLANSYSAVDTYVNADSSTDAAISAPMMTKVGSSASLFTTDGIFVGVAGTKKYTFTVGTASGLTDGAYNAVVSFPTIDDAAVVAYKVGSGTAAVSNADVLKAIVSLIASINKQIAALQRALLRR